MGDDVPDIVLATINAKYIHASFGLRCLLANLGELRARSAWSECTVGERPLDVAERILALGPRIVALGVYVWNVVAMTELVTLLKRLRPELVVILGGPEVSHEPEVQEIVRLADCTIRGEGEPVLPEICRAVSAGNASRAKRLNTEVWPRLCREWAARWICMHCGEFNNPPAVECRDDLARFVRL